MFLRIAAAAASFARELKLSASLLAALLVAACATTPPGHELFKEVMARQVGKRADDADFYPLYYRLRETDSRTLPNGDTEEQYAAGPKGECKLFFEATPGARRVVRWRYEGLPRDCVITPRMP